MLRRPKPTLPAKAATAAVPSRSWSDTTCAAPALRLNEPPVAGRRQLWRWGISLFLLSQVILPAVYYVRGEPTTERFAWRMFSSIHMTNWKCQVTETIQVGDQRVVREVPLEGVLQESSVQQMDAGQLDYATEFLRQWIQRPGVVEVNYVTRGVRPSGLPTETIELVIDRQSNAVRRKN